MKKKEYEKYKSSHLTALYPTYYYASKHIKDKDNEMIVKVDNDGYKIVKIGFNEEENRILGDVYSKNILNVIQDSLDVDTTFQDGCCVVKIKSKQPINLFNNDLEIKITDKNKVDLIKLMSSCLNY